MSQFTDAQGRTWQIALSVAAVRKLKDALGVDLGSLSDGAAFVALSTDRYLLGDVLEFLCRDQLEAAGVDADDFAGALDGDSLDRGFDAVVEAVIAFTPAPARATVEKVIADTAATQKAVFEGVVEWAGRHADEIAANASKEVARLLDEPDATLAS